MRIFVATIAAVLIGSGWLIIGQQRTVKDVTAAHEYDSQMRSTRPTMIRAAGLIEGRTEEIELRARVVEQIAVIHVETGQWVSTGDVLLALDSQRLTGERDLATALLAMEEAKKERLENGFRPSEIETARQEYRSAEARLDGAEKAYARAVKLSQSNAVSQQTLDDLYAKRASLQAMAAAAKGRLETMELPARSDDLLTAIASVRAAQSRLKIAQVNHERARIRAPIDGRILAVEAKVGELTGPDSPQPLIIMSDTTQLRVVAEVDEYDALNVSLGQSCEITSDAVLGTLAAGRVVEIEPRMHAKQLFGQWAGERSDTNTRRVWIELETSLDLPIGLPVDVFIDAIEAN